MTRSFLIEDGNNAKAREKRIERAVVTAAIIFLVILIAITAYGLYGLSANREARVSDAQKLAKSHTDITYNVVSGFNEKTGNKFSIAIENPLIEGSWETFDPCTPEQRMLKIGDKVTFIYSEESLIGNKGIGIPSCYLIIYHRANPYR